MNKDHQSDRQSINLTIPPIFNPQGKSTSIGAIAEGFLSTTKATYSEIYKRYFHVNMVPITTERFFTTNTAGSLNILDLDHRKNKNAMVILQACLM